MKKLKPHTKYRCLEAYHRWWTEGNIYLSNSEGHLMDDEGDWCRVDSPEYFEEVMEDFDVDFGANNLKPNTAYRCVDVNWTVTGVKPYEKGDTVLTDHKGWIEANSHYWTGTSGRWKEIKEEPEMENVCPAIKTVTKTEIVPGTYTVGNFIFYQVNKGSDSKSVKFGTEHPRYIFRAEHLRKLAEVCNALADALEEGEK